jgi:glycerophosphoryl diester phosphodiesterase
MQIIAHRGASFDAPENTLATIRLGWDQGADAVEFDVRLTRDGQIVVIHDADTKRLAGLDRQVADQTLDELRQLDVGQWKGQQFAGERIPTLAEALAIVPAGKRAFVEVKCGPEVVPELKRVLAESRLEPYQTVVISFATDVITTVKENLPVPAMWVVRLRDSNGSTWTADDLIERAKAMNADGLDLSADPMITADFIRRMTANGLPVFVWTVNDPAVARQLQAAGVAGIATDRPAWLREALVFRPTAIGESG